MPKLAVSQSKYTVLGPLVWQLRFVPLETLTEQTYRAEKLIRLIKPDRDYPYDFVCFKLTEFKPADDKPQSALPGKALIADLTRFIAEVTARNPQAPDAVDQPAYLVSELAEKADVSEKTIRRWQSLGLARRSIRKSDGTVAQVVLKGTWDWFVGTHENRVARAVAFSRLTGAQRRWVVTEARKAFNDMGLTRSQTERYLASRIGRAVETIRYVIRTHDARVQPERRVFPLKRKLADSDKVHIWELYRTGTAVAQLARSYNRSQSTIYRIVHEARAAHWQGQDIQYVYSPEFDVPNASQAVARAEAVTVDPNATAVLSKADERALFRAFNYLKWRQSEVLGSRENDATLSADILDELERLDQQVLSMRRKLILANQALIISIAKRHLTYGLTLDELVSEGMLPLLKAIEKFEYTRGYKFSTYASWAIMKHFARIVPAHGQRSKQYLSLPDEDLDLIMPGVEDVDEAEAFIRSKAVQDALGQLDEREQKILSSRYSLDRKGDPQSLAQLGKKLGVTKERVRQIESRAMTKMHGMLKDSLGSET